MDYTESFTTLDESYLPQIAELFAGAFGGEPWHDDWSNSEQLNKYIRDLSCCFSSLNYGLFANGRLAAVSIGTVRHWWEGMNYIIEEFCVSPDVQHKGVGTRFMSMIEDDIRKRGISGIFLQTESNMPSYKFYRKNGFEDMPTHVSLFKKL